MTDAPATIERLAPAALIAFDIWGDLAATAARVGAALGGALPGLTGSAALAGGWRAIRVEPTLWWLTGPLEDLEAQIDRLGAALGNDGAASDLTGGFAGLELSGPAWRTVLMFGGVFDAEDPAFGAGRAAGTILHHASVRYDGVDDDRLRIHVAPSHAEDLLSHLRATIARL